ncbi:hypothetical protein PX554_19865 [Sphingomonas sp. H39-1-10]|uniref:hypothetical protein n=1 Tax=Sphingomonas pollutisoli TaxID=3030829 RepID=UPI0023BA21F1|nr:hypothetical protein [Sphingomonas pollutisoli]MDF0490389.1 hypothetical protein [Sphingomonas pollutisoli]
MWLIERYSNGRSIDRIAVPEPVRAALVRWYMGEGGRQEEAASIVLVQQARIGEKWIACDCLGSECNPPILTPAYLSESETYYLRRLTAAKRPEHRESCPFHREQVIRTQEDVEGHETALERPDGFFSVLKPAPWRLAQQPVADAADHRVHSCSVPRLARLLWRLLDVSARNVLPPLAQDAPERSIATEFSAIMAAAEHIEVAPGIALARVLWTHGRAYHSRRVFAGLRDQAKSWPRGHEPQGFLLVFADEVRGQQVIAAGSDPIPVATQVVSPSVHGVRVAGPYLALIVVGKLPEARGYSALRAYAQPICSGRRFVPVDSAFERATALALLRYQRRLDQAGHDCRIVKPAFDTLTPLGSCRPDFLVETLSRETGAMDSVIVEALGFDTEDYEKTKAITHPRMAMIAPIVTIDAGQLENGELPGRLDTALGLQRSG